MLAGFLLTEVAEGRMRKSRKTVNNMNLAGLTPRHYMNYLMLHSDLRDSVLYIGNLSSFPQLCSVRVYHVLFVCSVASQLLPSCNAVGQHVT